MTQSLSEKSMYAAEKHLEIRSDSASCLLGCIILNNNILFQAELKSSMFPGNFAVIYDIALELASKKIKFDSKTISMELLKRGYKDMIAIPFTLIDHVATGSNWSFYYEKLVSACQFEDSRRLFLSSFESLLDSDDPIQASSTFFEGLTKLQETGGDKDFKSPKSELKECIKEIEDAYNRKDPIVGLSTGLDVLDAFTLGLCKQQLYIIGARPSDGKTALALTLLRNIVNGGHSAGFLSAESPARQLMKRMIAQESRINLAKIKGGMLSQQDFAKMSNAAEKLYNSKMFIWDYPMTIPGIQSRARLLKNKFDVDVIFLDYIGSKIRQHKNYASERDFLGDISSTCADLSKELDIPFVALAQLNRETEGKRPGMKDFYGSSQIEKDADVMMAIWHKEGLTNDPNHDSDSRILFLKQRDGEKGEALVHFKGECVLFEERR